MKKNLVWAFVIAFALLFMLSVAFSESDTVFYGDYFDVTLPGKWLISKENDEDIIFFKEEIDSIKGGYAYISQIEEVSSSYNEELIPEYYSSFLKGIARSAIDGYVDSEDVRVGTHPAKMMKYRQMLGDTRCYVCGLMVIVNNRSLYMFYTKPLVEDSQIETDIRKIISSVKYHESKRQLSTDKEILFRGVPWGTSYTEAKEKIPELGLWALAGKGYKTYSIDDIVLGDYQGLSFEYKDINIIGATWNGKQNVAGYTTSDIYLYFAYLPVNERINHKENESALYAARYEFEPKNMEAMVSDLTSKLTMQYGMPTKEYSRTDWMDNEYHYTYWTGANETQVVLCSRKAEEGSTLYKDEVKICYVWLEGDNMLQRASALEKQAAEEDEAANYGTSNTDGL